MTYCFGDFRVWSFEFCQISADSGSFLIFYANFSWSVAQTPINYIIFWKSIMGTFSCIYVNGFNRLRFLTEVSTKLEKNALFFDNLGTITEKENMEVRQITPLSFWWLQLQLLCSRHKVSVINVNVITLKVSNYRGMGQIPVLQEISNCTHSIKATSFCDILGFFSNLSILLLPHSSSFYGNRL